MVTFPFEKAQSRIFGDIWRPVARAVFTAPHDPRRKQEAWLIVDSGADYTLLPRYFGIDLGVRFESDCRPFQTSGIGGAERVFLLPAITVQFGAFTRTVPVGFLDRDDIPPLLGRHLFMETFETYFSSGHEVHFSDQPFKQ